MHIFWKYITNSSLKMLSLVFLSSTLYAFCIKTKMFFVNQNKGKITLIIFPRDRVSIYELTIWFISFENGWKQKSKNTLTVEINQFCDG